MCANVPAVLPFVRRPGLIDTIWWNEPSCIGSDPSSKATFASGTLETLANGARSDGETIMLGV